MEIPTQEQWLEWIDYACNIKKNSKYKSDMYLEIPNILRKFNPSLCASLKTYALNCFKYKIQDCCIEEKLERSPVRLTKRRKRNSGFWLSGKVGLIEENMPEKCFVDHVENKDEYEKTLKLLDKINPSAVKLFQMKFIEELTHEQIAQKFNCTRQNIELKISKIMKSIRERLGIKNV